VKPRSLGFEPQIFQFIPFPQDTSRPPPPIYMTPDEFEAYRLVFYEGLTQEEAAKRMNISRGTLWRCLENARKKLATMLAEKRPLIVTHEVPPQAV